jgi:hypothetical protein
VDLVTAAYEKQHAEYQHIGTIMRDLWEVKSWKPIDAAAIADQILDLVRENKRHFSIICNTDFSRGGGKHWFCIFITASESASEFCIEIFDSQRRSDRVEREFLDFVTAIAKRLKSKCNILYTSDGQHQRGDTECGVYSLYYIKQRLDGVTSDRVTEKRIQDELMIQYRQ